MLSGKMAEVLRSKCFMLKTFEVSNREFSIGSAGRSLDLMGGIDLRGKIFAPTSLLLGERKRIFAHSFTPSFPHSFVQHVPPLCSTVLRYSRCCHEAHREVPKFQNPGIPNYWRDLGNSNFF